MSDSFVQDALPVTITGVPGLSQVSLQDVLKQAYGDQASSITSVRVAYYGDDYLANRTDAAGNKEEPFSYWDPTHKSVTKILDNGVAIDPSTQNDFKVVTINSADFAKYQIEVGNNIMPNLWIQVPTAHNSDGSTDYQELNVTTIPKQFEPQLSNFHIDPTTAVSLPLLTGGANLHPIDSGSQFHAPGIFNGSTSDKIAHFPGAASAADTSLLDALKGGFVAAHTPTAAEIVAAAQHIASLENGVSNVNDCHFIASDIAAAAGAPLDPDTETATSVVVGGKAVVTETPVDNQEGGYWRIEYRGSDPGAASEDWQAQLKPGDIVRVGWNAANGGGFHTFTVTQAENAAGQIEVVDNYNNKISEHPANYLPMTAPGSVTVYRLTTDGNNLIDETASTTHNDTFLGTAHNDLMKAGSGGDTLLGGDGNDTLVGGKGNDTLDGGSGDNTAVFTGKESNYHYTFNADGSVTVADQRSLGWNVAGSPDGTDTLKNIQHIQFSDKTVDVSSIQAYTDTTHSTVIMGGEGNDILSAQFVKNAVIVGGSGADLMFGGSGNDIYYVDNAGDSVVENPGNGDRGGIDEVRTTLSSYALPNTAALGIFNKGNIENLTYVGSGNFNGVGNSLDNVIKGGAGMDTLTGGAGNDTLDGGGGLNTAVYSGNASDYKISVINGVTTITDLRAGSPDGTDTLKNIELLKFADGIKHFSASDYTAGSASINDVSITEGTDGSKVETFTVTRTGGNAAFDVNFATSDGTATTADHDYVGKSGTLHFDAGVVSQTVSITVNGDTKVEGVETFNVNLSGATNGAAISHGTGVGTILNDDTVPVATSHPGVSQPQGVDAGSHEASPAAIHHVANDFNGDGISDLLFANSQGKIAMWQMDGDHVASNATVNSTIGSNWHEIGIADFGDDGKADVLWQDTSGHVAMWKMDGDHVASNTTVGSIGSDWHAIGAADFSGDGKADVLWENAKGQVAMWKMDGDHIASNTTVGSVGTDWKAIGTGDFNHDGKADLLWENSKGQVAMWEMDGDHVKSNTTVGSIGTDWKAIGTGDFNGDGNTDILWQNSKGQVAEWQMDGDHIKSNASVSSIGTDWKVIGTGDYNHDGKADVMWQNSKGQVAEWQMNGDHVESNTTVASHSVDWHSI